MRDLGADSKLGSQGTPQLQIFLNSPILKMLLRLALPNMVAIITMTAIIIADASYIGRLGTVQLASLALVFPFQSLMQMMAAGAIGGGITSSVSRALGRNRQTEAEEAAWHGFLIVIMMSVLYTIILGIFCGPVLSLFDASNEVVDGAIIYSRILFGAAAVGWVFFFLCSILRAIGEILLLSRIIIVSSLVQIILSGALTLGLGPLPSLGIAGPALAMVFCHGITTIYMLILILKGSFEFRLRPYPFKLLTLYDIMKVGGIGLINSSAIALTVIVVTRIIGSYGTSALAGYGLGSRLEIMVIPIAFGIGGVLTPAVGANFGANQFGRARNIAWTGCGLSAIFTGLIGIVFATVPNLWLDQFTSDPAAYEYGALYLGIVAPLYGLFGGGMALYFASQGTGHMVIPVSLSLLRLIVVGTVGFLSIQLSWGLSTVFGSVAIGLGIIGIGMGLNMFSPTWRPKATASVDSIGFRAK